MAQPSPRPEQPEIPAGLVVPLATVTAGSAARQAVTEQLVAHVRSLVESFTSWYDELAVKRLAREISAQVRSAQLVAAGNEDAYLTSMIEHLSGKPVRPAGTIGDAVIRHLRESANPDEVYERLAVTFRYEVSRGLSPERALAEVLTRAEVMNDSDVTLAVRAQDQRTLQATRLAVAYRRVIHPELAKDGTCGMCIVASDRVYKKTRLMPIHARCHCTVAPILAGGIDPGSGLNNLDLATLYEQAGGTQAPALKRTRYAVDEHGELGPTLIPKRRGRGAGVSRSATQTPDGLQGMSDERLAHLLNLTEGLKDSAWRTSELARLRAEVARRAS